MRISRRVSSPTLLLAMLALFVPAPGFQVFVTAAVAAEAAPARIEAFDKTLLETMKQGAALGAEGRYRKLAPAVEATFDLTTMTRFAVGPSWAGLSGADRAALVKAFTRLSVASYAHNFDSWSGETFEVDPAVVNRGPDIIVKSRLHTSDGKSVDLLYRMRQTMSGPKVVDVYFDGISQLTTRRSDFAAPLASGGAKGLVTHLDQTSDKLLR